MKECTVGLLAIALVIGWALDPKVMAADRQASIEFFEARIRPVLIEYCYECHNSQQREGGLALDSRDGVAAGGDRQKEMSATRLRRNLILEAIRHDHEDLKMPEGGAKLSQQTIADFEKWFADGAIDPRDHPPAAEELVPDKLRDLVFAQRAHWWALQPLAKVAPPIAHESTDSSEHPIDRFIEAALREQGLEASPPATPTELLRRLGFTLTGLPPSVEELAEFESSADSESIERAVDRLLMSPQFGERWARHWMDWIRYAESHGSEGDPPIPYAYQYRDYLVRALNADVPYDRLVEEHLAGDLLPSPRINAELGVNESAIGPAHLRMVFHGFAPTDALEEKVRFIDDQVAAVSKAFLGLTVACARCHDHKFDAIRQTDYYALFGILGSCHPGIVDANTQERQTARQPELIALKHQIRKELAQHWLGSVDAVFEKLWQPDAKLQQAIEQAKEPTQTLYLWKHLREELHADKDQPLGDDRIVGDDFERTMATYQQHAAERELASATIATAQSAASQVDLAFEHWFAHGNGSCRQAAEGGEFTVAIAGANAIDSILPSGRYSHLLSTRHRNVWLSPRVPLDQEMELWLLVAGDDGASVRYAVEDYPRNGTVYPVVSFNGRQWQWQKFDLSYWQSNSIHIELATAADAPVLARDNQRSWFGIRNARLLVKGQPAPASFEYEPFFELATAYTAAAPRTVGDLRACWTEALRKAITAWRGGKATDQQAVWLDAWLRAGLLPAVNVQDSSTPTSEKISQLVQHYRDLESQVPLPTRVPGVLETVAEDQRLFVRGDHRQADAAVPRGFLSILDDQPYRTSSSGRLELAQSIVHGPGQALAARVIVNRLWHHLFGRGLVATPDNFGKLGVAPTHPELLDYLAGDLIDNGWSLKRTIRLIVTSRTWQQSSQVDAAKRERDPDNLWLARAPVRRLEAEAIRDAQLSIAGRLDRAMYGESVKGSAPRRSLYVRVFRNSLEPQLRVFDFPEPTSTIGRRDVTNVPAQSLMLLNDPQIHQLARQWIGAVYQGQANSEQTVRAPVEVREKAVVQQLFRSAFGRWADPDEVAEVLTVQRQLSEQNRQALAERRRLDEAIANTLAAKEKLLAPVRTQTPKVVSGKAELSAPTPVAAWEFDTTSDSIGNVAGELIGQAHLDSGALVTEGGYFVTTPLPFGLHVKSLEAWVTVEDLQQRGGGVLSVQSLRGDVFDAIVLGEQRRGEWLAGSNVFARTKPFDGPVETVSTRPIHLAVVYAEDGRVSGYRDGVPYGQSYLSNGPQAFAEKQCVVTVGCRHLPAGGNKLLRARWERAHLYDRALTPAEVAASFKAQHHVVDEADIVKRLSDREQQRVAALNAQLTEMRARLQKLGERASAGNSERTSDSAERSAWTDVALALMSAKEFIFIK